MHIFQSLMSVSRRLNKRDIISLKTLVYKDPLNTKLEIKIDLIMCRRQCLYMHTNNYMHLQTKETRGREATLRLTLYTAANTHLNNSPTRNQVQVLRVE